MPSRRHAKHIACLVLAWFVLSMGAAVAAPLMQSNDFVMICSSTGMVQLMPGDDDGSEPGPISRSNHILKCPLCMLMDAPPDLLGTSPQVLHLPTVSALVIYRRSSLTTSACAAPFPARGPPAIAYT